MGWAAVGFDEGDDDDDDREMRDGRWGSLSGYGYKLLWLRTIMVTNYYGYKLLWLQTTMATNYYGYKLLWLLL